MAKKLSLTGDSSRNNFGGPVNQDLVQGYPAYSPDEPLIKSKQLGQIDTSDINAALPEPPKPKKVENWNLRFGGVIGRFIDQLTTDTANDRNIDEYLKAKAVNERAKQHALSIGQQFDPVRNGAFIPTLVDANATRDVTNAVTRLAEQKAARGAPTFGTHVSPGTELLQPGDKVSLPMLMGPGTYHTPSERGAGTFAGRPDLAYTKAEKLHDPALTGNFPTNQSVLGGTYALSPEEIALRADPEYAAAAQAQEQLFQNPSDLSPAEFEAYRANLNKNRELAALAVAKAKAEAYGTNPTIIGGFDALARATVEENPGAVDPYVMSSALKNGVTVNPFDVFLKRPDSQTSSLDLSNPELQKALGLIAPNQGRFPVGTTVTKDPDVESRRVMSPEASIAPYLLGELTKEGLTPPTEGEVQGIIRDQAGKIPSMAPAVQTSEKIAGGVGGGAGGEKAAGGRQWRHTQPLDKVLVEAYEGKFVPNEKGVISYVGSGGQSEEKSLREGAKVAHASESTGLPYNALNGSTPDIKKDNLVKQYNALFTGRKNQKNPSFFDDLNAIESLQANDFSAVNQQSVSTEIAKFMNDPSMTQKELASAINGNKVGMGRVTRPITSDMAAAYARIAAAWRNEKALSMSR